MIAPVWFHQKKKERIGMVWVNFAPQCTYRSGDTMHLMSAYTKTAIEPLWIMCHRTDVTFRCFMRSSSYSFLLKHLSHSTPYFIKDHAIFSTSRY